MPPKKNPSKKKVSKKETTETSSSESEQLLESENKEEEILSSDEEELDSESEDKECDIDNLIKDDNEFFNQDETSEIQVEENINYLTDKDRITNPRLTRYEMVRIIGERTKQLTMGAKALVKNHQDLSYEEIAIEELKHNMMPFKIKRPLPNNKVEIWRIEELNKKHLESFF